MSTKPKPDLDRTVFRKTNQHLGRNISVTPRNSTNEHLSYGRIILNSSLRSASFNTEKQETGLICLSGAAIVNVGGQSFDIVTYDSIYIPQQQQVDITTSSSVDFAEFSVPVEKTYPLQFIRYADLAKDSSLKFTTGVPGQQRHISICLGKNVQAGRLLAGFTFSEPGNWTSWPPHEHAKMLEEMYVYFNMPAPAFGLQLVYNDRDYPELVVPVRDGDAVLMPSGYHPNVSIPGHTIGFLWAMAAHREKEDRQFGVVNVQPEFGQSGTGLEASRK